MLVWFLQLVWLGVADLIEAKSDFGDFGESLSSVNAITSLYACMLFTDGVLVLAVPSLCRVLAVPSLCRGQHVSSIETGSKL